MRTGVTRTMRLNGGPEPHVRSVPGLAASPHVVVATSVEFPEWASTRRAHHAHVVAARPSRGPQSISNIAGGVLLGLGKRPDLSVMKQDAEHVAAAWLTNGAAADVIIYDAQLISAWLVPDLIAWFCGLGIIPWVVYQTFDTDGRSNRREVNDEAGRIAGDWGVTGETERAIRSAFPDRRPTKAARRPTPAASALPMLPRVDGMVFRTACKRQLPSKTFQRVDREFVAAVTRLRREFAVAIEHDDKVKRRPLSRTLRAILEQQPDTETFVLWARAAQVAALSVGWMIRVHTVLLCAAAETIPRPGAMTPDGWDRIDGYRDPDFGAMAALTHAGCSWHTAAQLRIADLDDDGTTIRVTSVDDDGEVVVRTIDERGARYLRVLCTLRRRLGADDTSPLFGSHRKDGVRPQFGFKRLTEIAADTGVVLADLSMGPKATDAEDWLARHGITWEPLAQVRLTGPRR